MLGSLPTEGILRFAKRSFEDLRSQAGAWERVEKLELGNAQKSEMAMSMTRTRYRIFETEYPYFLTNTIVGWLPVFTRREAVEIVFEAWRYHQQKSALQIFAFVVLENHFHMIARAPKLSDVLKSIKSYSARQIIDLLVNRNAEVLLRQLRAHKLGHKSESDYQVWQEGSHPQQIQDDEMMWQKLEYIHHNPVERGYVDDPLHWRYSSARNYARQPSLIDVLTDWK